MKTCIACVFCAGLLVMTMNSPADIVWSGAMSQRAYHDVATLDINQDGINDFTFNFADVLNGEYQEYSVAPDTGGIVVENETTSLNSVSLPRGALISPTLNNPDLEWDLTWHNSEMVVFGYSTDTRMPDYGGGFADTEGYLGVSFEAEGATHYGWICMSNRFDIFNPTQESYDLHILGWAYESTPNTGIVAGAIPEPSTGILTVGGSLALLMLARRRVR